MKMLIFKQNQGMLMAKTLAICFYWPSFLNSISVSQSTSLVQMMKLYSTDLAMAWKSPHFYQTRFPYG